MDTLSLYASAVSQSSTKSHPFEQTAAMEPIYGPVAENTPLPQFEVVPDPEPVAEAVAEAIVEAEAIVGAESGVPADAVAEVAPEAPPAQDWQPAPVDDWEAAEEDGWETASDEDAADVEDPLPAAAAAEPVAAEPERAAEPIVEPEPAPFVEAAPGWASEYGADGTWEPTVDTEPTVIYEPAVAYGPITAEASAVAAGTDAVYGPITAEASAQDAQPAEGDEVEQGWVQQAGPLESLEFAERRVIVRLLSGETLEVATAGSATEAVDDAKEIVRRIATAEESGEWPELAGRFVRPDTIVSVDVQVAG